MSDFRPDETLYTKYDKLISQSDLAELVWIFTDLSFRNDLQVNICDALDQEHLQTILKNKMREKLYFEMIQKRLDSLPYKTKMLVTEAQLKVINDSKRFQHFFLDWLYRTNVLRFPLRGANLEILIAYAVNDIWGAITYKEKKVKGIEELCVFWGNEIVKNKKTLL